MAGRALQPGGLPALRLRRVRAGRGRLHDGGHLLRGRLARGAPAAVQPVLDLRLEPGDHRGPHRHHLHRGRRGPLPRLRLERHDRGRRQRPRRRSRRALHTFKAETERPTLSWCTATSATARRSRTRRRRTASRWARDGVRATKRFLGLPEDADFYVPHEVYDWFAQGVGARGDRRQGRLGGDVSRRTADAYPDLADELDRMQRRELPGRLGGGAARPSRPTPRAWPPATPPARCSTRSPQAVPWLLGGSADLAPVDQDPPHLRRRRRLPARRPRRAQPPLRHPGARGGRRSPTAWR